MSIYDVEMYGNISEDTKAMLRRHAELEEKLNQRKAERMKKMEVKQVEVEHEFETSVKPNLKRSRTLNDSSVAKALYSQDVSCKKDFNLAEFIGCDNEPLDVDNFPSTIEGERGSLTSSVKSVIWYMQDTFLK